ncbi:hypothetical protein KUCAC02_000913 [Chaenocephalus aceratus]|uniref:Uncharacterized protein n=1 Tax=Chaenocephalus aceratus TaxID=36190 RepID=A0ACB9XW36_CHAAC|nr:hypothetical protein KUCAC02_000913 [Chaenocephalus aceratus]
MGRREYFRGTIGLWVAFGTLPTVPVARAGHVPDLQTKRVSRCSSGRESRPSWIWSVEEEQPPRGYHASQRPSPGSDSAAAAVAMGNQAVDSDSTLNPPSLSPLRGAAVKPCSMQRDVLIPSARPTDLHTFPSSTQINAFLRATDLTPIHLHPHGADCHPT